MGSASSKQVMEYFADAFYDATTTATNKCHALVKADNSASVVLNNTDVINKCQDGGLTLSACSKYFGGNVRNVTIRQGQEVAVMKTCTVTNQIVEQIQNNIFRRFIQDGKKAESINVVTSDPVTAALSTAAGVLSRSNDSMDNRIRDVIRQVITGEFVQEVTSKMDNKLKFSLSIGAGYRSVSNLNFLQESKVDVFREVLMKNEVVRQVDAAMETRGGQQSMTTREDTRFETALCVINPLSCAVTSFLGGAAIGIAGRLKGGGGGDGGDEGDGGGAQEADEATKVRAGLGVLSSSSVSSSSCCCLVVAVMVASSM